MQRDALVNERGRKLEASGLAELRDEADDVDGCEAELVHGLRKVHSLRVGLVELQQLQHHHAHLGLDLLCASRRRERFGLVACCSVSSASVRRAQVLTAAMRAAAAQAHAPPAEQAGVLLAPTWRFLRDGLGTELLLQ